MYDRKTAYIVMLFVVLAGMQPLSCHGEENSWTEEPRLKLRLTIGDETHEIEGGRPSTITIDGQERSVVVTSADYRTFDNGGVRFDYPARFRFYVKELVPGALNYCALEGDGVSIHVKEHTPKLTKAEFAEYARKKHKSPPDGLSLVEQRKVDLKTPGTTLSGLSFQIAGKIGGQDLVHTDRWFLLPSQNREACILLTIQWQGEALSRDAVLALSALENSLRFEESKVPVTE